MDAVWCEAVCLHGRHFTQVVVEDRGKCGDNIAIGRPGRGLAAAQISSHVGPGRCVDSKLRFYSMNKFIYRPTTSSGLCFKIGLHA